MFDYIRDEVSAEAGMAQLGMMHDDCMTVCLHP